MPRRFATREELVALLRKLGDELGRTPTARDLDARRGRMPSKSLYWHTFGSLSNALREAGYDVAVGEERLERAVAQGAVLARRLGRLPRFADWAEARRADAEMLTEWQVYRMFDSRRGAWATFQFLVRRRLIDDGVDVRSDGSLAASLERRGDRREAREADLALVRRAHGGQRVVLDELVDAEPLARLDLAAAQRDERALGQLALAQLQRGSSARRARARASSRRRRCPRGPGRATAAGPCRARRSSSSGSRSSIHAAAIEPWSASSARASLRECAASAKIASESTVIAARRARRRARRGARRR